MSKSLCSKDLYCTFLRVTSQRYSALSLSEVSPVELSHDSISRWLEEKHCMPKDIWQEAEKYVSGTNGVIIADETVSNKSRSQKVELVRWQYSGTEHCQARTSRAQRNHIVLSVLSWIKSADVRRKNKLSFYQQQWDTIKQAIAQQLKYELTVA